MHFLVSLFFAMMIAQAETIEISKSGSDSIQIILPKDKIKKIMKPVENDGTKTELGSINGTLLEVRDDGSMLVTGHTNPIFKITL